VRDLTLAPNADDDLFSLLHHLQVNEWNPLSARPQRSTWYRSPPTPPPPLPSRESSVARRGGPPPACWSSSSSRERNCSSSPAKSASERSEISAATREGRGRTNAVGTDDDAQRARSGSAGRATWTSRPTPQWCASASRERRRVIREKCRPRPRPNFKSHLLECVERKRIAPSDDGDDDDGVCAAGAGVEGASQSQDELFFFPFQTVVLACVHTHADGVKRRGDVG